MLLGSPTLASKRWVYEQYDTTVGTATRVGPGTGDAAVIMLPGTPSRKAIAAKVDGNGRYTYLNPRRGGRIAVAEAARNVACVGAEPVAITNCLNFGNPLRPGVFFQFREAVLGMGDACRALGTPVTGGNVSFYNESPSGAVLPTPMVGMVGVLSDVTAHLPAAFQGPGDVVLVLGRCRGELGGSQYLSLITGETYGAPPRVDLTAERALVDFLVTAAERRLLRSAHDVSEGGVAVALAECAMGAKPPLGLDVDLTRWAGHVAPDAALFGEDQGRAVVSVTAGEVDAVLGLASQHHVPATVVGTVGSGGSQVRFAIGGVTVARPVSGLREIYEGAIPRRLAGPDAGLAAAAGG